MFTDRTAALNFIKEMPTVRDIVTSADDAFLIAVLDASTGQDAAGALYYRAYYVAAQYLNVNSAMYRQSITVTGDGRVTNFSLEVLIQSYYNMQTQQDAQLGLTPLVGTESTSLLSGYRAGRQAWTEDRSALGNTSDTLGDLVDDIIR